MTDNFSSRSIQIHESAYVEAEPHDIGERTKIWHFCHVMAGARLGPDCNLGQNVFVDREVRIGARVKIQNNVSVYRGVDIEDDVFVGPSVVFTNVRNPRSPYPRDPQDFNRTRIERGATLGANATIVCGVSVGAWSFVAAGAVVTKAVPPHALVAGVPARQVGRVCRCGQAVTADRAWPCPRCGVNLEEIP